MPIYEYKCCQCGHEFEELVMGSDDKEPICPKCEAENTEKLMSGFSRGGNDSGFEAPDPSCGSGGFT